MPFKKLTEGKKSKHRLKEESKRERERGGIGLVSGALRLRPAGASLSNT